MVVCRNDDWESRRFLAEYAIDRSAIRVVDVHNGGLVEALNAGVNAVRTRFVAITDDDAAPRPDWIARIVAAFEDASVGAVGGRDVQIAESIASKTQVGVVQWFGRQVGNHHVGMGPARNVHVLKGVNMAFRLAAVGALRFDKRLRGAGAQTHNEVGFCLAIRSKGWRVVYDPAIIVDHYPASRTSGDQRAMNSSPASSSAAFNQMLAYLDHLPMPQKIVACIWACAIGTRVLPGFMRAIDSRTEWRLVAATVSGRFAALATYLARPKTIRANHTIAAARFPTYRHRLKLVHHLTSISAVKNIRTDLRLPVTERNIESATSLFRGRWLRTIDKSQRAGDACMAPIGSICVGGSSYAAVTALILFGGTILANKYHAWIETDVTHLLSGEALAIGRRIDLSGTDSVGRDQAAAAHRTYLAQEHDITEDIRHGERVWIVRRKIDGRYVGNMEPNQLFDQSWRVMRSQSHLQRIERVVDVCNAGTASIYRDVTVGLQRSAA